MANRQKPESNSPIIKRLEQARQEGDDGEIMAIKSALYLINNPLGVVRFPSNNSLLETLLGLYEDEYLRHVRLAGSRDGQEVSLFIADIEIIAYNAPVFKDGQELNERQLRNLPRRLVQFEGIEDDLGLELIFSGGKVIYRVLPENISIRFPELPAPPTYAESPLDLLVRAYTAAERYIIQTPQRILGHFK